MCLSTAWTHVQKTTRGPPGTCMSGPGLGQVTLKVRTNKCKQAATHLGHTACMKNGVGGSPPPAHTAGTERLINTPLFALRKAATDIMQTSTHRCPGGHCAAINSNMCKSHLWYLPISRMHAMNLSAQAFKARTETSYYITSSAPSPPCAWTYQHNAKAALHLLLHDEGQL